MKFEIDFNNADIQGDDFLINVLGAEWTSTGSSKYPPFEVLKLDVKDFNHLEEILKAVDAHFKSISTALVSFDPPTIHIDLLK